MAPKGDTGAALDEDALTDNAETEGLDEFDPAAAGAAGDEFAAYAEAGKTEDVDARRELIPEDTKCSLGFTSAELATAATNAKVKKGHEYIYAKFEVNGPEMYADGSRNFGVYFRLSARANDPQRPNNTAWNVSRRQLVRIAAAINQCKVTDPAAAQFDQAALVEAANCQGTPAQRCAVFFDALTKVINEDFVGKTFDTDIGVDAERVWQGRKFSEAQSVGRPYYPERERAKPKSAKKPVVTK